jgi:hypothetical protein
VVSTTRPWLNPGFRLHVQEYGFVTNRTLQRLFDRDLFAARNMLSHEKPGFEVVFATAASGPRRDPRTQDTGGGRGFDPLGLTRQPDR